MTAKLIVSLIYTISLASLVALTWKRRIWKPLPVFTIWCGVNLVQSLNYWAGNIKDDNWWAQYWMPLEIVVISLTALTIWEATYLRYVSYKHFSFFTIFCTLRSYLYILLAAWLLLTLSIQNANEPKTLTRHLRLLTATTLNHIAILSIPPTSLPEWLSLQALFQAAQILINLLWVSALADLTCDSASSPHSTPQSAPH